MSLTVYGFGQRGVIKVPSSNTTLSELRDMFCAKFNVAGGGGGGAALVFARVGEAKRPLDMSLPFRLSGLVSGATVELVRSSAGAAVAVAVQLPDGARLKVEKAVAPADSLLAVLRKAEGQLGRPGALTLASDPATGCHMQSVVVFMQREIATNEELRRVSLASLGVTSGSALLRLSFRKTTTKLADVIRAEEERDSKEQETREMVAPKPPTPPTPAPAAPVLAEAAVAPAATQPMEIIPPSVEIIDERERQTRLAALVVEEAQRAAELEARIAAERAAAREKAEMQRRAKEKEERLLTQWELDDASIRAATAAAPIAPMEVTPKPIAPVETDVPESEREVTVFPPQDMPFDPASIVIPDEFYDMTAEDLAAIRAVERKAKAEQAMLMTREMRERLHGNVWERFKRCTIRVRLPDRIEIQRTFLPNSRVAAVEAFVRECLADPSAEFVLFTTPPMEPLGDGTATLLKRELVPAALVHLKWKTADSVRHPFIKPELMQRVAQKLPPDWSYFVPVVPAAAAKPTKPASEKRCSGCLSASAQLSDCEECGNAFCGDCWAKVHVDQLASHHRVGSKSSSSSSSSKTTKSSGIVPKWFQRGKKL
jgi:hypothetical protein